MAMADPTNVFAMDDIKFMTGLNVEPVIASEASIQSAIGEYYSSSKELELADVAVNEFSKLNDKLAKNGNAVLVDGVNGAERLADSDLDVSLDAFQFNPNDAHSDGELEVVEENEEIDLAELAKASEDAPVVRLVNVLLVDALRRGASDIHVEPYEKDLVLRLCQNSISPRRDFLKTDESRSR
jgi:type IV pilus assembly protein PilB